MTINNTELKKQLNGKLNDTRAIAADKILTYINSELTDTITVRYETCNSFYHYFPRLPKPNNYRFEIRFTLVPNLEKTFGAEIELTCNNNGLFMNYGTCGSQNLGTDLAFIQKNLLIGILTLHQDDIKEFILTLPEILEANEILDKIYEIDQAEWEARKKAQEEAAAQVKAQKEAEKKAKDAERRKARRAARKTAQN